MNDTSENITVKLRHVNKRYRSRRGAAETTALLDINLEVRRGEIMSVIGPSGCGKSTMLRIIAGLDTDFTGEVQRCWKTERKKGLPDTGFVFQSPTLLPWRSVRKNIALGLEKAGLSRAQTDARIGEMLEMTGLADFADSYPNQLSGGMQQRVQIARALAYDPPVLLMDEPFGALDYITREQLQEDLLKIWQSTEKNIILVTHATDEAAYLSKRVCVLSSRPGTVKAVHTVPISYPRTIDVKAGADFAQFQNLLREELKDEPK